MEVGCRKEFAEGGAEDDTDVGFDGFEGEFLVESQAVSICEMPQSLNEGMEHRRIEADWGGERLNQYGCGAGEAGQGLCCDGVWTMRV